MAARYVNPQNVVAQGLSFYTGLVPGSFEQGGAAGGKNVMGAGHGGSAGVTADRTASDAAVKSIKNYAPGGSILKTETSDLERNTQALQANTAGGGSGLSAGPRGGGTQGSGGTTTAQKVGGFVGNAALAALRGTMSAPATAGPAAPPPHSGLTAPNTSGASTQPSQPSSQSSKIPSWGRQKSRPPQPVTHAPSVGGWNPAKSSNAVLPSGNSPTSGSGRNTDLSTDSLAGMNPIGVGIANSNAFQALQRAKTPSSMRVQNKASSRAHTRQPGVQQSATQQSLPFPNMANSTVRSTSYN